MMNFASKQCWKPSKMPRSQQQANDAPQMNFLYDQEKVDTNVLAINFDPLPGWEESRKEEKQPLECAFCGGIINKNSKLSFKKEKVEIEAEESKNEEVHNSHNVWECDFCNKVNKFEEGNGIPKNEETIYVVNKSKEVKGARSAGSVLFVVDISGSMSVTAPSNRQGDNSQQVSSDEFEDLKQFMDPEDVAEYERQRKLQARFISRRQCVIEAIKLQVENLARTQPEREVGIITFGTNVTLYGDGTADKITISGDSLQNCDELFAVSAGSASTHLKYKVGTAKDKLITILNSIREGGQTALGPALMTAVGILSKSEQQKGSTIILCTDGLANIGVGALNDIGNQSESTLAFYDNMKLKLKELDIVMSVITLKGEGCKMEILGSLADVSGGCLFRVDPSRLEQDFASVLGDEIVALKAEMKVILKKSMKFRNTDPQTDVLSRNGSTITRHIGTATKKTSLTFEYAHKTDDEMCVELNEGESIEEDEKFMPFQVQIRYNNIQGDSLICVIGKNQEITHEKAVAESSADNNVIHQRVQQHTAQLIQNNDFSNARKFNKKWENYVNSEQQYIQPEQQQLFNNSNNRTKQVARNFQQKRSQPQSQQHYQQQAQLLQPQVCQQQQQQQQQQFNSFTFQQQMPLQPPVFQSLQQISSQQQNIQQIPQIQQIHQIKEEKEEQSSIKPILMQQKEEACQIKCEEELFSGEEDDQQEDEDEQINFMYNLKNNQK